MRLCSRFLISAFTLTIIFYNFSLKATPTDEENTVKDFVTLNSNVFSKIEKDTPEVTHLKLLGNVSSNLKKLCFFKNLESLDLSDVIVGKKEIKNIQHIFTLTTLKELNLSSLPLDDILLSPLTNLKKLENLSLRGTYLMGSLLPSLASACPLVRLDVSCTHITDDSIRPFLEVSSLKWLNVDKTFITEDMVRQFEAKNVRFFLE